MKLGSCREVAHSHLLTAHGHFAHGQSVQNKGRTVTVLRNHSITPARVHGSAGTRAAHGFKALAIH